jgi:hypothetical protein
MDSHECATIRLCSKCGTEKLLEHFSKKSVWCKPCVSAYDKAIYQRKREIILKQKVEYRKKNKAKVTEALRIWAAANVEYRAEYQRKYRREKAAEIAKAKKAKYEANKPELLAKKHEYHRINRDVILAKKKEYYERPDKYAVFAVNRERRRTRQEQATPAWADLVAMRKFYEQAKLLTKSTGIVHHVDHIIPLHSTIVCGLHSHTNLRVITAQENYSKSNKLIEDIV